MPTVPNLFFKRWTRIPLDAEAGEGPGRRGNRRGTRKSDKEREPRDDGPVRARATAISESVAEENHLKPFKEYGVPIAGDVLSLPIETAAVSV